MRNGLSNRLFSLLAFITVVSLSGCMKEQPNILFIFADDQSYETVHSLGNDEIITPNLDRLVESGVTFTYAYNQGAWNGAVCLASRAMINTGRFLWHAWDEASSEKCIQWQEEGKMWAQLFEQAGYETYMTGKWHVGADPAKTFNVSTDIRGGMPKQTAEGYNRPVEGKPDPWDPSDKQFGGFWEGSTHWSKKLANTAVKFINQASGKKKPFFMYLAFNAAHDPRQSPVEYIEKYPLNKISLPDNYMDEYPFKDQIGCGKNLRDEKLAPFPRTPKVLLFNLKDDPSEQIDLSEMPEYQEKMKSLLKNLEELQKETGDTLDVKLYFTELQ